MFHIVQIYQQNIKFVFMFFLGIPTNPLYAIFIYLTPRPFSAFPSPQPGFHGFIISIQPLGRFEQRPELSQAIGMALVRCILGKFLWVGCHCFPPRF